MPKPIKKPARPAATSTSRPVGTLLDAIRRSFAERRFDEGFALIDAGLHRHPRNPDVLLTAARHRFDQGDPDGALLPLGVLLGVDPDRPEALVLGTQVYGSCGLFSHSVRCARRLSSLDPDHPAAKDLSALEATAGKIFQSIGSSLGRTMEDVEEAEFWYEEGYVHSLSGSHEASLDGYRNYATLLPESARALAVYSDALVRTGKIDEAEGASRRSLAVDPDGILASWSLIRCARIRGDAAAMDAAYSAIRTADPGEFTEDRRTLAQAHGVMGDHEAAYAVARKLADLKDQLTAADLVVLGGASANSGRDREALGYYRMLDARKMAFYSSCLEAVEMGMAGPGIALRYPYLEIPDLVQIPDFVALAETVRAAGASGRAALHERVRPLLERLPQLVWIGEKILWEKDAAMGITILLSLPEERAHRIVEELPTHPDAPYSVRLDAASALMDWGEFQPDQTVEILAGGRTYAVSRPELDRILEEAVDPPALSSALEEADVASPKNPRRAEKMLRDQLDRYPNHPRILFRLARVMSSNPDESDALFQNALAADPDDLAIQAAYASSLALRGDTEQAVSILEQVSIDRLVPRSDRMGILYTRFLIHAIRRRTPEAIAVMKEMVREDPEYEGIKRYLKPATTALRKGIDPYAKGRLEHS